MSEIIREKVDVHVDCYYTIQNPKTGYITYGLFTPLNEFRSMNELVHLEIPLDVLYSIQSDDYLKSKMDMDTDDFRATYLEDLARTASLRIVEILDRVIDLDALSLQQLQQLRDEYDEEVFWENLQTPYADEPEWLTNVRHIVYRIEQLIRVKGSSHPLCIRHAGKPGYVYLLKSSTGHWKIGRATDPNNRIRTFGIQLPFEVEFEHLIPTNNMVEAEMLLHETFASKRIRGEWFDLSPEDITYIKSIERI